MKAVGFKCGTVYRNPERCKNKTFINEKHLNQIIIEEVKKKLSAMEIDKIIDYYQKNNEEEKKLKKYKNEIEKLERKKGVLYEKKCENNITIDEFKIEYERVKDEIRKYQMQVEKIEEKNKNELSEKRIKEIIAELKRETEFTNEFLKKIINRIEIYSNLKIKVIFNF